jgi:peptidylprolyl isomerase
MRSRYFVICTVLAAGVIAGCGSSNSADTAHIQAAPSASQTLSFTATSTSTTASSTTTTSTTTTPTITTPKTGPLSKEPTITVPSGPPPKTLVENDLITGTGATAADGDTITVNYVGALYSNGEVFDASWRRHSTFTLPGPLGAGSVIKGWDEGIVGMRVGGRRELIIPPALGYGKIGNPPVPPNATLIFIIDLLGVTPAS